MEPRPGEEEPGFNPATVAQDLMSGIRIWLGEAEPRPDEAEPGFCLVKRNQDPTKSKSGFASDVWLIGVSFCGGESVAKVNHRLIADTTCLCVVSFHRIVWSRWEPLVRARVSCAGRGMAEGSARQRFGAGASF